MLLFTGLNKTIGNPREYEKNVAEGDEYFEKVEIDMTIPLEDTNEWEQLSSKINPVSVLKMRLNNITNRNLQQRLLTQLIKLIHLKRKRKNLYSLKQLQMERTVIKPCRRNQPIKNTSSTK